MLKIFVFVALVSAVLAEDPVLVSADLEVLSPDIELKTNLVPVRGSRVIYGRQAVDGQFPFLARLVMNSGHLCTGSIISANFVLTARHCFAGLGATSVQVSVGSTDQYSSGNFRVYVNQVSFYNGASPPDIAIFRLSQNLAFNSRVQAVQLPRNSQANSEYYNSQVTVIGWGGALGGLPRYLQYGIFRIRSGCGFASTVICSYGESSAHAQGGDSGGPMVINENGAPTLIGINVFITSNRLVGSTKTGKFLSYINSITGIPIRA